MALFLYIFTLFSARINFNIGWVVIDVQTAKNDDVIDDDTRSCKILSFESRNVVSIVNVIYFNIPYILGTFIWIWIYVYMMVQFPPKFMTIGTVLILIQSITLFWMAMSPVVPHMGYTYPNSLVSPELLQILVTLTAVIKPLRPNFLGRAIVILNFVRRFRNFIADTVHRYKKNITSVWKHFCNKVYRN